MDNKDNPMRNEIVVLLYLVINKDTDFTSSSGELNISILIIGKNLCIYSLMQTF